MAGAIPEALSARAVLRRYYTVSLVYALAAGSVAGVYPPFLRARGLDQLQINSVLAVYFALTFLTDVPTGAFADALGRRRAFVLGTALRALAFGTSFVVYTYLLFLVAAEGSRRRVGRSATAPSTPGGWTRSTRPASPSPACWARS